MVWFDEGRGGRDASSTATNVRARAIVDGCRSATIMSLVIPSLLMEVVRRTYEIRLAPPDL
jgi:hypothetical protein